MLDQSRRDQLNGIIGKMKANREDDSSIREMVNQFKAKFDAPEINNLQPNHDLADSRLPENRQQAPRDYSMIPTGPNVTMPDGQGKYAVQAAIKPLQFAGNVAQSLSTGLVNAPIQAFQDKGFTPGAFATAIANEGRNLVSPYIPGYNPIQSTETSFERADVPNTPMRPPMRYPGEVFPGGDAPMSGLASQLGTVTDVLAPVAPVLKGPALIKAAGESARSRLANIAEPIGAKLQDIAVGQSKSITPFLSRHVRQGAEHETFFKEGLMGPKEEIFSKAKALKKELGQQQGEIIRQGRDEGVRINGLEEIDNLLAPHLSNPGASPQSARLTDPASQKFINKAKTFITRLSTNKDGILDLQQAQTVKQWLQKQAEYTGPADAAGIPLVAAPGEAAQTAADLGHQFRKTIEEVAPPELAYINKRLNKLYPVERAAGWRQMIRDRQPPVSLKDFVGIGQIITSPIWAASKLYGSGRVANAIYKLGSRLKGAKTEQEAARIVESLKKIGMDTEDINSAVAVSKSADGMPKNEDELKTLFDGLKFGEPKAAQATPDPWANLYPESQPGPRPEAPAQIFEGMAPPEMAQQAAERVQSSREAFIRQGRERALDLPPKPRQPPEGPNLRVIPRPPFKPKPPPTQKELFGPSDMTYRKSKMREWLQHQGVEPFEKNVMRELEKLGPKPVPKVPDRVIKSREFGGRTKPEDHEAMADILVNGGHGVETVTVKAEDAPNKFTLGGVEFTKGRTLYGKTTFKGIRDRKFQVDANGNIHMDAPPKVEDKGYPSEWDTPAEPPAPTLKESLKGKTMKEKQAIVKAAKGAKLELSAIKSEAEKKGITLNAFESKDGIKLSKISVPKELRGQGLGTQAMRDLINYADSKGRLISLSPSSDFGGSIVRLRKFYKNLGFIENKGRNKDFSISETMYREPLTKGTP